MPVATLIAAAIRLSFTRRIFAALVAIASAHTDRKRGYGVVNYNEVDAFSGCANVPLPP